MPPTIPSRKVLVLFYSFTGKTADLAREVGAGAAEVEGSDVRIMRVPELIPESVFEHKPELKEIRDRLVAEFPEATVGDMMNADAIAFGTPVHFGSFASQIKQFIDQLSPVWLKGDMVNKPAAVFCSAGTLHAGEETALISLIIPLLNLGMLPIGIPYPIQGEGPDFEGGSPYGAVYTSGHRGELPLGEADKKTARILGKRLANTARLLAYGNAFCEACTILRREA